MENRENLDANDPQVEVNDTASAHAQDIVVEPIKSKKVKAKFGLKPFTFFSGLFDILIAVVIFAFEFTSISFVTEWFVDDLGNLLLGQLFWPFVVLFWILLSIAGILCITLGIMTVISSFRSDRRNWNGLVISTTLFDLFLLLICLVASFIAQGTGRLLCIAMAVLLGLAFVFKIIDSILTKKRLKKYEEKKQEYYRETYKGPNFENLTEGNHSIENLQKQNNDNNSNSNDSEIDFFKLGK